MDYGDFLGRVSIKNVTSKKPGIFARSFHKDPNLDSAFYIDADLGPDPVVMLQKLNF